jgi:transposase
MCKANSTATALGCLDNRRINADIFGYNRGILALTVGRGALLCGINIFTLMSQDSHSLKLQALRRNGTLNRRADRVGHPLFAQSDFFDARDLAQLKYEALRALEKEDWSLAQAAAEFGVSRPTIYQAKARFQAHGMEGLLPGKRGPKQPHKLTAAVSQHLREWLAKEPGLTAAELARRLRQRFKVKLHRRTIEKALKAGIKKGRAMTP